MNVWLLEDDFRIASIHANYIKSFRKNVQVEQFLTGAALKEALQRDVPHVLLMDVFIPDVQRHELIMYVRHQFPSIYVIVVSAAAEQEHVAALFSYGVFDYILKPFDEARLHQSLTHVMSTMQQLQLTSHFSQAQIDTLFYRDMQAPSTKALPKGIDAYTLERVEQLFEQQNVTYTATALSDIIGTSRSTARRYLEHLVERGMLEPQLLYGSVGRPERNYVRRATYEQN